MTKTELRSTLKALDMSQSELSDRLGVALSTVSAWATGKAPVPQYATAYLVLLSDYRNAMAEHPIGRETI